jgi:hypothetical protein
VIRSIAGDDIAGGPPQVNAPAGVTAHVVVCHVAAARFDQGNAVLGAPGSDACDARTDGLEQKHAPTVGLEDLSAQDLEAVR